MWFRHGTITVKGEDLRDGLNRLLIFKDRTLFKSCISEFKNTQACYKLSYFNVLVYNLLRYSKNYSTTSGSLWEYIRDDPNDLIKEF